MQLEQLDAAGDPPFPRCSGTLTAVSVTGIPGSEVVALFGGSQGFFEGFSNSLCILQGDENVSISDAASQHKGLTWREPLVVAADPDDGVPDARWGHSAVSWNGKLVLFGGSNTQHCKPCLRTLHENLKKQQAVPDSVPTNRRTRSPPSSSIAMIAFARQGKLLSMRCGSSAC